MKIYLSILACFLVLGASINSRANDSGTELDKKFLKIIENCSVDQKSNKPMEKNKAIGCLENKLNSIQAHTNKLEKALQNDSSLPKEQRDNLIQKRIVEIAVCKFDFLGKENNPAMCSACSILAEMFFIADSQDLINKSKQ